MATRKKRNLAEITEANRLQRLAIKEKEKVRELKKLTAEILQKKPTPKTKKDKKKSLSGRTRNVKNWKESEKIRVAEIRKNNKENRVKFLQQKYSKQKEQKLLVKFLKTTQKQRQEKNPDIFKSIKQAEKFFESENFCKQQIEKFLFKGQVICPYCEKETIIYKYVTRKIYKCKECERQFNFKTGTPFHKTKKSLSDWLRILLKETSSERGLTCQDVKDEIGVTIKTAHSMLNKLRASAFNQDLFNFTDGSIIATDTTSCLGSNVNRYDYDKLTKPEIYKKQKHVIGMKQELGYVLAFSVPNLKASTMLKAIAKHVPLGCTIYTDEHVSFDKLKEIGYKHETTNHSLGEHARGKISTNGIESFNSQLKTGLRTHNNRISEKYLDLYINSIVFNLNTESAKLTLCEKFFLALENLCKHRQPQKQIAKIKKIQKKKSVFAPTKKVDFYKNDFDKEYQKQIAKKTA